MKPRMCLTRSLLMLAWLVLILIACTVAGKPIVVIMSPPSGSQFFEGEDVAVQSSASDLNGVVRVELVVDGTVVRVDSAPSAQGQPNFTLIQTWKATPGVHTIVVRAYNNAGAVSDPTGISVNILQRTAQVPTPTLPGAPTLVVPTSVVPTPVVPTSVVPTSVVPTVPPPTVPPPPPPTVPPPPPPTEPPPPVCSGTPVIPSFTASPATITAGGSSTLSWSSVTNAEVAEIDQGIGGVETPGTRSVSPAATTTYTLSARCGSNVATKTVTVTVNPPPADVPAAPTGLSASTTGQTTASLTWMDNATNEDGFKVYRSISGVDPSVGTRTARAGTGNTTMDLIGLTCSETYVLYVKSYKGSAESAASNYVTINTDPCTPSNVVAPSHTGKTVTVTWMDNSTTPEETGFKIYFGTTLKKTVSGSAGTGTRSTVIDGLDCGTTYSDIRVSAVYGTRESPKSASAGAETTTACQVKVEFTKVDIKNDTDSGFLDPGEIRLTLTVEGSTQYWPSYMGSESILSGGSKAVNRTFNLNLNRSNPLNISVHAQDVEDDPDDMGTLTATHAGSLPTNFGAGSRSLENSFFKIYYIVSVTAPP